MTMQHPIHPDDERLAALAGDGPEARADDALAGHVAGCSRCGELVSELRLLRSALADLPDLPPSRPLQLVPPVTAVSEAGGALGWLRRLGAPAMAAGAGLALVGAVGFGGLMLGGMAASAGAAPEIQTDEHRGNDAPELTSGAPANFDGTAAPEPVDGGVGEEEGRRGASAEPLVDFGSPTPWLVLIGSGGLLLVAGLVLRFAIRPRAG